MNSPLTPLDCDLRNFPHMPLDVVRLRDSDLAALEGAEEFRAAVLLWCASWHQIPAASLPDDDKVLANLAGFGRVVKEWLKVREGALRGWIKCSDGRLYHPVIAEKALSALDSKYKQEWRTEIARIRKHNQRHRDNQLSEPDFETWLSYRTNKNCLTGHEVNVSSQSHEKQHPTEQNRTEQITVVSNTQSISNVSGITPAASACIAIKEVYDLYHKPASDISQSNPTLQALLEAGATEAEFRDSALAAMQHNPPKGFSWILGRVKGQRKEAANIGDIRHGAMPATNAREAGIQAAAKSIFKPEHIKHLTGGAQEIEVQDATKHIAA